MRTLNDNLDVNMMDNKSIFQNAFRAGRPVLYNHRIQANYRLPFEYLPFIDFIDAELGYGMTYNWNSRSTALLAGPEGSLGTIGQNTNTIVATATADFPKLFSKMKYFRDINTTMQKRKREIDSLNTVYTAQWEKRRFRYKDYKFKNKLSFGQSLAYGLASIRQLDFSYNENNGTVLPGLLSAPNWYGYGQTLGGPTTGFLLGSQSDIRRIALENGWISTSTYMTDPYIQMRNRSLTANLQVVPVNDFRIDFNILHNYTRNFSQAGYNDPQNLARLNHDFAFANDFLTYSNTAWTFNTAFTDGDEIYRTMISNARAISQQMPTVTNPDGFKDGYGIANAYILIPAFQAAVEGKNPDGILGDAKKSGFPLPNWRLVYSGLRNIPMVNSYFSKFDILHAYNATKTATGIQSSIDYFNDSTQRDVNGNFVNPFTFSQVGYVEAFAPLVGVDVTMRNNIQLRAHYNRDRMFMLGLVNNTLTEDAGTDYVVGFGYIIKDFRLGGAPVRRRAGAGKLNTDLNIRGDFQLRDNKTRISNILLNDSQITGGQRLFSIKVTADYNASQNLNLMLFYDQMMTKYKISTAFPLSTIRAGIRATFTFDGGGGF